MTKLLQQALAEVESLSDREQDAIPAIILEEFADEKRWQEKFAESHDVLSTLAAKAKADIQAGKVREMGGYHHADRNRL